MQGETQQQNPTTVDSTTAVIMIAVSVPVILVSDVSLVQKKTGSMVRDE